VPAGAAVIDGTGLTACPGFFDAFTGLGLVEVAQVPASNDSEELGDPLTPQLRASDAFYLDSKLLPVVRAAGTLVVLSPPGNSNVIAGQSMLARTAGASSRTSRFSRSRHSMSTWEKCPSVRTASAGDRR